MDSEIASGISVDKAPQALKSMRQPSSSRSPHIRFAEHVCTLSATKSNLRGDDAIEIAQKLRQDHVSFTMYGELFPTSVHQKSPSQSYNSQIKTILQPDLIRSPVVPRPSSPSLRGEESREFWRQGLGTISLKDASTMVEKLPNPANFISGHNEEFLQNLHKDKYRRRSFLELDGSTQIRGAQKPLRAIPAQKRDEMCDILNQGWSETTGPRRAISSADIRRGKAATPYSNTDSVAGIWTTQPPPDRSQTPCKGPSYFHEESTNPTPNQSDGVSRALNHSKNAATRSTETPQPRVHYEGIEIAENSRSSDIFGGPTAKTDLRAPRIKPEAEEYLTSTSGDNVKCLIENAISSISSARAQTPPPRRKLSPVGRRIAHLSRGGAAKACLNPPPKKPPSRRY